MHSTHDNLASLRDDIVNDDFEPLKRAKPTVSVAPQPPTFARRHRFLTLLDAWRTAGVVPAICDSASIAALMFPEAETADFSEVALRVSPEQLHLALALANGWQILHTMNPHENTCVGIADCALGLVIRLQTQMVPPRLCSIATARQITTRVMQCTSQVYVEGRPICVPCLEDQMLVTLALRRCWSTAKWHPREHDAEVARVLIERGALTEHQVRDRARHLGLERTWEAYCGRAHPFANYPVEARTNEAGLPRWRSDASLLRERFPPVVFAGIARLRNMLPALPIALLAIWSLAECLIRLRRQTDPARLARIPRMPLNPRFTPLRICHAVRMTFVVLDPLVRRVRIGPCVLRSVSLFRCLALFGHEADWVLGFSRDANTAQLVGHAWVELGGIPAQFFGDESAPAKYTEAFRSRARVARPEN